MHTNKNFAFCSTNSSLNLVNSQTNSSNKLLCTDKPLILSGSLAAALKSAEAAIVLQQVHYWLSKKGGKIIDGVHWIHNTYEQWLEQFPWLTKWRLRKVFYRLRETEILKFAQHDQHQYKQRGYYTIDYDKLNALQGLMCEISTHQDAETQTIEVCNARTSIEQENSLQKELLTENTHPPLPAAVNENLHKEKEPQQEQMMTLTPQNTAVADSEAEAASQETKLELIKTAGIRLNVQLSALVQNFTLENVKNAIAYYQQTKQNKEAQGKTIKRPAGWLTDCLRQNWYTTKPLAQTTIETEFSNWYKNAIASGIVEDLPISWLTTNHNRDFLVRQCKPGLYGAPYTLISWRELQNKKTEPNPTQENTKNLNIKDDFEEFD
ncbi:hypothetical protein QT972_29255 [Microcoleus sp. herbarium7]|uniref:hypothetical protein n=1 Tax=Microcoleus sp. herbarium7 TaxID=3055435 RepID=UPI002FD7390D